MGFQGDGGLVLFLFVSAVVSLLNVTKIGVSGLQDRTVSGIGEESRGGVVELAGACASGASMPLTTEGSGSPGAGEARV